MTKRDHVAAPAGSPAAAAIRVDGMTVARGREDIGVVEARPRFGRIELPAIGMVAALGTTGVSAR